MEMFCYQCQETVGNRGCTKRGVCGKTAETAALQDLLIWALKGLSYYGVKGRELEVVDPENLPRYCAEAYTYLYDLVQEVTGGPPE